MKESKPKSIRIIGIVLAVISILTVVSNIVGLFVVGSLSEAGNNIKENPYYAQSLANAKPIATISSVLALGSLVAGIFLTRYKNWARMLAQVVAAFYLLFIWYQFVFIAPYNSFDKGNFGIDQLIGALLLSAPIVLLIRHMNKENIKNYFA